MTLYLGTDGSFYSRAGVSVATKSAWNQNPQKASSHVADQGIDFFQIPKARHLLPRQILGRDVVIEEKGFGRLQVSEVLKTNHVVRLLNLAAIGIKFDGVTQAQEIERAVYDRISDQIVTLGTIEEIQSELDKMQTFDRIFSQIFNLQTVEEIRPKIDEMLNLGLSSSGHILNLPTVEAMKAALQKMQTLNFCKKNEMVTVDLSRLRQGALWMNEFAPGAPFLNLSFLQAKALASLLMVMDPSAEYFLPKADELELLWRSGTLVPIADQVKQDSSGNLVNTWGVPVGFDFFIHAQRPRESSSWLYSNALRPNLAEGSEIKRQRIAVQDRYLNVGTMLVRRPRPRK